MLGIVEALILSLKFFIPALFNLLFRIFGLGYKSKSRAIIGVSVFVAYNLIMPTMLIPLLGYETYKKFVPLIIVVSQLVVFYISSDSFWRTAFLHTVQANVIITITVFCNFIRYILHLSQLDGVFIIFAMCFTVYALSLKFLAKPLKNLANAIKTNWFAMVFIPFATLTANVIILVYLGIAFGDGYWLNVGIVYLFESILFIYLFVLAKNLRKNTELAIKSEGQQILKVSALAMQQQLTLMNDSVQQMRIASHDRRHFNNTILELINNKQTKQAIKLLENDYPLSMSSIASYCENTAINAAISYYAQVAIKKDIDFNISVEIPEKIDLNPIDICMVLSNLIENAIHSCADFTREEKPYINLKTVYTGQLIIEIENSVKGQVLFDKFGYPTTKSEGHGLGTKSVLAFVSQNKGEIIYTSENNNFKVRLLI